MITKLIIKNFKLFHHVEIELGNPVVFIGPNNSGKTSALQVLALWDIGLKRWLEKRKGAETPKKRSGVTINRRDLISLPVPDANLLWHKLHVRDVQKKNGKQETKNIRIDVIVEGITNERLWKCGLEFDYSNSESLYCRPLGFGSDKEIKVPEEADKISIAFLPPMSGLAANESRLDHGAINVRIGEGRTAEVLRNLCHTICETNKENWEKLVKKMYSLFGVTLEDPQYVPERGEIIMSFREGGGKLDLSSAGRGLQQTLLLLAYMYSNPGSILLLDEPDAHLEILRQRQIYTLLTDVARENNNQIIAASHSEVLLNEAAEKDVVVAFLGSPHRINDRGTQLLKSLKDIGFEDYYLAEQRQWVLYLEGSTDLAILQSFAEVLEHAEAKMMLESPFVHYAGNKPLEAKKHFYGIKEAVPDLKGIAIFDNLRQDVEKGNDFEILQWSRREIENYLCDREILITYAREVEHKEVAGPLFSQLETEKRLNAMNESIEEVEKALETLKKGSPWDVDTKVSKDFLPIIFDKYFKKLKLPNVMLKKNYHVLAKYISKGKIDAEVKEKLDAIVKTAQIKMKD